MLINLRWHQHTVGVYLRSIVTQQDVIRSQDVAEYFKFDYNLKLRDDQQILKGTDFLLDNHTKDLKNKRAKQIKNDTKEKILFFQGEIELCKSQRMIKEIFIIVEEQKLANTLPVQLHLYNILTELIQHDENKLQPFS